MPSTDPSTPRTAATSTPSGSRCDGTAKWWRNSSYVPSTRWTSMTGASHTVAAAKSSTDRYGRYPRGVDDRELLAELEPTAINLYERHLATAKEWFPHEMVPWSRGRD